MNKKGFTLIELIFCLCIVFFVIFIIIPNVTNHTKNIGDERTNEREEKNKMKKVYNTSNLEGAEERHIKELLDIIEQQNTTDKLTNVECIYDNLQVHFDEDGYIYILSLR